MANYRTTKITKRQKLQNGEIQNVESYRMVKNKMSKTRDLQKNNLESNRTVKYKTSNLTDRQNTKWKKTLNGENKIAHIGQYMKNIYFILHGN
jgi:hypothetical protein